MEKSFELSFDELANIQYIVNRRYAFNIKQRAILISFLVFLFNVSSNTPIFISGIVSIVTFFLLLILLPKVLRIMTRKLARKMTDLKIIPAKIQISPDSISFQKLGQTTEFEWECLKSFEEYKDHFELHFKPVFVGVVYNKIFLDDNEKAEFIRLIESNSKLSAVKKS